ncbi:serine protease [Roseateles sp. SL47]|uniref:S1 family peptidase n=1 Tax=Roseateles sp. SL47 TaxID=2995138 RepID=UPI002271EC91|nr:serine protease [Roseateles sp. SL47]WAC71923.1 serine protease [Roseateles sp. SL47]
MSDMDVDSGCSRRWMLGRLARWVGVPVLAAPGLGTQVMGGAWLHRPLLTLGGSVAGLSAAAWSGDASAQEMSNTLPDLIDKSRQAVVAVGTFSATDNPRFGFRGTGFMVGDGKTIVTCSHVIPNPLEKDLAILVPGVANASGQAQPRSVKLLRRDALHDLALLELDEGKPLVATLPLATVDDSATAVREGVAVALMGYPLGTALGVQLVTHRGIVAAITKAALPAPTSNNLSERAIRQLRGGDMEFLQLDITAYPGNSGGPLMDIRTGKVVGVVNMVALKSTRESALSAPSGISYAVPVKYVLPLLTP